MRPLKILGHSKSASLGIRKYGFLLTQHFKVLESFLQGETDHSRSLARGLSSLIGTFDGHIQAQSQTELILGDGG